MQVTCLPVVQTCGAMTNVRGCGAAIECRIEGQWCVNMRGPLNFTALLDTLFIGILSNGSITVPVHELI